MFAVEQIAHLHPPKDRLAFTGPAGARGGRFTDQVVEALLLDTQRVPVSSSCTRPLLCNPTIAFRAADKVIGDLLHGFSARDSNSIPPSLFVVDEDMRTGTLNSRLSFESHSLAAWRVPNLSIHPYFAAALTALSIWLEGQVAPPAHISSDCLFRYFRSGRSLPAPAPLNPS
jgi:hypothetical protein